MDDLAVWRQVVRTLDLRLDGRDGDALVYSGSVDAVHLKLSAVVEGERARITVDLRDPSAEPGPWMLARRAGLLTEPRTVTGDPAFDADVAIAVGGPELLVRLGRDERARVRDALALVAALDPNGARLTGARLAGAAIRPLDAESALHAIRTLEAALVALREPALDALVARYGRDEAAPEVARAVGHRVEGQLDGLRGSDLLTVCGAMARSRGAAFPKLVEAATKRDEVFDAWMAVAPDDPQLVLIAEGAVVRGRGHARLGALAASLLRREGPSAAFQEVWALPDVAAQFAAVDPVLDAIAERPSGECSDLLLTLRPPEVRTAIKLAERLERDPDPRAVERLGALFRTHPAHFAVPLVRRAHADRATRPDQLEAVITQVRTWKGSTEEWSALLDGLLHLPSEAADLIGALSPREDPHQLRIVRWLARGRGAQVEASLLGWLEVGSLDVALAAARALATAGGARALKPLEDVAAGWRVHGELRAAARAAAQAIRDRPGVGGLSIVSDPTGRLSPVDDRPGRGFKEG